MVPRSWARNDGQRRQFGQSFDVRCADCVLVQIAAFDLDKLGCPGELVDRFGSGCSVLKAKLIAVLPSNIVSGTFPAGLLKGNLAQGILDDVEFTASFADLGA